MDKKGIKLWLDKMKIKNYSINKNLTVDVDGSVDISGKKLKKIPVQFNKVGGGFYYYGNQLATLEGAPRSVGGDFWCFDNPLNSLEGKPDHVGGGFYIDLATYNRMFRKDKNWSLDDVDEMPAGNINIRDEIYK